MKTIRITSDNHGLTYSTSRATRYLPKGLVGTTCETHTLRELLHPGRPVAAVHENVRAPQDWPAEHGDFASRLRHPLMEGGRL